MMDAICTWPDGQEANVLVTFDNGTEADVAWLDQEFDSWQHENVPSDWLTYRVNSGWDNGAG